MLDASAKHSAAEIVNLALKPKPELVVYPGDLPATAEALRDTLAASGKFFDRGVPVRIVRRPDGGPPAAGPLTKHNVVMEAHRLCQPVRINSDGKRVAVTLPDRVSQMHLDMHGEWCLPSLTGISTAPCCLRTGVCVMLTVTISKLGFGAAKCRR